MTLTFTTFPIVPAENNIFFHTGNPDISAFTCDVSAVTPTDLVDCEITDVTNDNIKGVARQVSQAMVAILCQASGCWKRYGEPKL